jgi:hypothetical protein
MTVVAPDGKKWVGQLTNPPTHLDLTGPSGKVSLTQKDFSLEALSSASPLRVNDPPIRSNILFHVSEKKNVLMSPESEIEISVADFSGKRYQATQRLGDWLQFQPIPATPVRPDLVPSVTLRAYLQPDEPYFEGTLLAGIVWQKQFVDVRLDIANGPVAIQNLDFLVGLDTSIAGVGQISQFPGITAFPAGSAPSIWIEGTDSQGNPVSIPATPPPGMMQSGPVYRVHCSNVFADTVIHLVVASIALNPPENGQLPKQLFAPRRPPKLIKINGKYETLHGGLTETHTIEYSTEFR